MPEFRWCERHDVTPHRSKAINNFGDESGSVSSVAVIVLTSPANAVNQPARGRRSVDANVPSSGVAHRVHGSSHDFHVIEAGGATAARSITSTESVAATVSAVDHVRIETWRT